MASLTNAERKEIVQRLAVFEPPTEVAEWASEEFGKDIDRTQVFHYDPTRSDRCGKRWEALFEETRREFLDSLDTIPLSHKAVRLRELSTLYQKAKRSGEWTEAASMLKQAAKEMGGKFTNRSEMDVTSDGEKIQMIDFRPPSEQDSEEDGGD